MKKYFLKTILAIIVLLIFVPCSVKANEGDLRYEVSDVTISGTKITFKGWAFIHRTNNFVTADATGKIVKENGGQKILIRAIDQNGKEIKRIAVDGSNYDKHNFYCELFNTSGMSCTPKNYENTNVNSCLNDKNGVGISDKQCYYEDINFKITFDLANFSTSKVKFQISASNDDFEAKVVKSGKNYFEYNGDKYTSFEDLFISKNISINSNEYIKINYNSFSDKVEFIASYGILFKPNNNNRYGAYGSWDDGPGGIPKDTCNNIYTIGNKITGTSNCGSNNFLEKGYCKGTGYYLINVNKDKSYYNGIYIVCPSESNNHQAKAVGSHVKLSGTNSFEIELIKNDDKLCDVSPPNNKILECNNSKNYNSTCNNLTVKTNEGKADVKITQTGTVSNVLTPITIYAGGGFNFGVIYTNTVKWEYLPNQNISDKLHNKINEAMNTKIKDYEVFAGDININEMSLNGKTVGLIKKCNTSSNNKDYYNKELSVSCVFSFPLAIIEKNGNVYYDYDVSNLDINNKYYTPIEYKGDFYINAKIEGMNRIVESIAKTDSAKKNIAWTGKWEDEFKNCKIDIYSLLITPEPDDNGDNGKLLYNFIYRPINLYNPFPDRNAGINWFDWYKNSDNKRRLENTYSTEAEYIASLNNYAINDIKTYNSTHNYLEWESINEEGKSSFITEKNYIVRVGDSS